MELNFSCSFQRVLLQLFQQIFQRKFKAVYFFKNERCEPCAHVQSDMAFLQINGNILAEHSLSQQIRSAGSQNKHATLELLSGVTGG